MAVTTGETDIIGGGGYGGFGGFGGIAPIGLIGLNTFLGGRGFGNDGLDNRGGAGTVVLEQNVSNIREEIGALGNEIQSAFATQNLSFSADFRSLDNRLCESEKSAIIAANNATVQGMVNTQSIKDQAANFQVVNQENFCSIKEAIHADGDATRALMNQIETQNLRDRINELTRRGDQREVEINIQNTATATQLQFQQQMQQQQQQLATFMNVIGDQIARQTNSIVNLGTMTASGQSNSAAQTKVNS